MCKMNEEIKYIIEKFDIQGNYYDYSVIKDGHINITFSVKSKDENGCITRYLLQNINTFVFKNPEDLMFNVQNVTTFLREKIASVGGDTQRETLTVIKAKDGKNFFVDDENNYWRVYKFVENSFSYNIIESPEIFQSAGIAFGKFQRMLADYPMHKLYETIPDFHDTYKRLGHFQDAVNKNCANRVDIVQDDIKFVLDRKDKTDIFVNLINEGKLPLRVTHNDTKLNNVLFDNDSKEAMCVVDLDTVMPGLSLYDFGDAIRFGASTASEDEKDLSKVHFDTELFKQYSLGFLKECGKTLTGEEIKYLPLSAWMMTFECGMRFLTDYLNGDVYFGTLYPEHNLDRCHTQFKLVEEMEEKMDCMTSIISEIYASL